MPVGVIAMGAAECTCGKGRALEAR